MSALKKKMKPSEIQMNYGNICLLISVLAARDES